MWVMSKEVGIKDGETAKDYKKRKKQESKSQKENNEMKNIVSKLGNFAKTVLPWLILLALLSASIGWKHAYEQGKSDQKKVSAEIVSQVASLKESK